MNVSIIIVGAVIVIALSLFAYWTNKKQDGTKSQKEEKEATADSMENLEQNKNKQGTGSIRLSKENYIDYLFLDVVAFSCASGGAQGVGGEIIVITRDASIYRMNYVYGDMTIEMCIRVCPPLRYCISESMDVEVATFGWKSIYLGGGNCLMLEDSLYDRLLEQIADMPPYDLYCIWMDLVLNDIRAHLQDAKRDKNKW